MGITAQVSLYPLRQQAPPAEMSEVLQTLRECALEVEPNDMTTMVVGDDATIFAALRQAFCHAAEKGQVVMVVTFSNACPVPGKPKAESSL